MLTLQGTCLPYKVYDFLYQFKPLKPHFRCAQGRHFLLFCWLLVALIVDQGKGTLKGLSRHLPPRLRYWALMRMGRRGAGAQVRRCAGAQVRSSSWAVGCPGTALGDGRSRAAVVARTCGWSALCSTCGASWAIARSSRSVVRSTGLPVRSGRKARINEYAAYPFGFEMVLLVACWDHYRITTVFPWHWL